jgi:predicted amidohydrolase YtcJ
MLEAPAMLKVIGCAPLPTRQQLSKALDDQWNEYANCGFTTVTEMGYMPDGEVDDLIQDKAAQPDCPLRLALYTMVFGPGDDVLAKATTCCNVHFTQPKKKSRSKFSENEKLWIAGVKIVADGSPHCGTAAVREAYLDTDLTKLLGFPPPPSNGTLNFDDASLLETVKYWHGKGYQIAAHVHGERAIEQVLSAYEQVRLSSGVSNVTTKSAHQRPRFNLGHSFEALFLPFNFCNLERSLIN